MSHHLDDILSKFDGVKPAGGGYMVRCPAHNDRTPSLLISDVDGALKYHCYAGCEVEAVKRALDVWEEVGAPREPATEYAYTDEHGRVLSRVIRFPGKEFRQCRPDGTWGVKGVRQVVYRLPAVRAAVASNRVVVVCEGEKDADNLAKLGITATCNAGGAGKWKDHHAECLRGAATVAILPDNDEPGRKHAAQVKASLSGLVKQVVIVELPGLAEKGDATDWIRAGGSKAALAALIEECLRNPEPAPAPDVKPEAKATEGGCRLQFTKVGDIEPELVEWLWYPYLPRGELVVLAGQPGTGKSSLSRWLAAQISQGVDLAAVSETREGWLEPPAASGRVQIVCGLEDHPSKVVAPLLRIQGAALDRVEIVQHPAGAPITTLHLDGFRQAWEEHGAPDLLVIDPASSVVPNGTDGNAQSDVKASVTGPLSKLAQDFGTCVLLVAHVGKASVGGGAHPSTWVLGSTEWVAGCRSALVALRNQHDQDDPLVRVYHAKANLGPTGPAYAYEVVPVDRYAKVEWRGMATDSPADLVAKPRAAKSQRQDSEAAQWLHGKLVRGRCKVADLKLEALQEGLSAWQLRKAREAVGAQLVKDGGVAYWALGGHGDSKGEMG